MRRFGLLVILLFFLAIPVFGQGVGEAWVARYNGLANHSDQASDLALDQYGNVYVTGFSLGSGFNDDYATIKYSANGDTLWLRRYNGPGNGDDQATCLAVDDSGNVYVTGMSDGTGTVNNDYATVKYSPNGDTLWVRRYNGPGNSLDKATALAVDDSGNVYVTGESDGGVTDYDYATIKYAANGTPLWVSRYNGPGNLLDQAYALALDGMGNLYVTGYSYGNGTSADYATIKYTPAGDTLWIRRYNGPGNGWDNANALAVDDSGNVYVTGYSVGSGSFGDYATIKYKPNGDTLWIRRYNGPSNRGDGGNALALDQSGNLYVTGGSYGIGTFSDYATIKYAPNGDTLWVRRYNGPADSSENAYALALDDSGNVYVTGESDGGTTDYDYATIKYAANGDPLWIRRYNGPGDFFNYDRAVALAVTDSGNVYVTGYSYGIESSWDYCTIKYSPCLAILGDVNSTGDITLGDIIHLVNYIFDKDKLPCLGSDPGNCWTPDPFCRGDVNQTGTITIGDIVHLVNYIFDKDRLPCLGSDPGNCWMPEANGACCLPVP